MASSSLAAVLLFLLLDLSIVDLCQAQDYLSQLQKQQQQQNAPKHLHRERVSWCTTSLVERRKCLDWARAIEEANIQLEGLEPFKLNLDCAQGNDRDQCMSMIDDERADMILLDPGEIGDAGRYHSLTPIMAERYGPSKSEVGHFSVAVVKKRNSNIQSLSDLYGKRACFSSVSHMASWTLPLASLMDLPRFDIVDCNNLVKSTSYFFGNSCAPNALINKFNPTGDNPQKMTYLCERQNGRVGAHSEPYNGAFSALKCLSDPVPGSTFGPAAYGMSEIQAGDVAFIPHNTVFLAERLNLPREVRAEVPSRTDLELLCPQGGRAPLDRWQTCNFGFVPAHAVIVSSRTSGERRESIQRFLKASIQFFSGGNSIGSQTTTSNLFRQDSSDISPLQQQQQQQRQLPASPSIDLGSFSPSSVTGSRSELITSQDKPGSLAYKLMTNFKLNGDHSLVNYPSLDVLFSSDMTDLVPLLGVSQTFKGYLNSFPVQLATTTSSVANSINPSYQPADYFASYLPPRFVQSDNSVLDVKVQTDYFEKLRRCSVPAAVLCVSSEKEYNKCHAMSKAFHAAGLKPELNCKLAQSTLVCMQLIKNRDADLVVLDAADIYLAGVKFGLIPIVMENIDKYQPSYYSVAVAKKSDQSTDLFSLKGKLSCHSGFLKGAGWVMPMSFLLNNDRMRRYDNCDSARSAAEHFDKSCAPGVLSSVSSTQNTSAWSIRNMCELCHGTGRGYCARDSSEPFFGDTGAFRCLVEGGGQVAFCKHTAIFENTGGSNRETWARNLIKSDFELICRDGTRAQVHEYKTCNLGSVPPNAIVTRGDTPNRLIDTYVNLFIYGQQYYGSKYSEEYTFKMFSSNGLSGKDLIFQDATQQLARVPLGKQLYSEYLSPEFQRALESVYCEQNRFSLF